MPGRRFSDGEAGSKVYIGNVDRECTQSALNQLFAKFGRIATIWIARQPPGFAFVTFEDPRDAADAVKELDSVKFMGKHIRVELARGSAKGGGAGPPYGSGRRSPRGGRYSDRRSPSYGVPMRRSPTPLRDRDRSFADRDYHRSRRRSRSHERRAGKSPLSHESIQRERSRGPKPNGRPDSRGRSASREENAVHRPPSVLDHESRGMEKHRLEEGDTHPGDGSRSPAAEMMNHRGHRMEATLSRGASRESQRSESRERVDDAAARNHAKRSRSSSPNNDIQRDKRRNTVRDGERGS